MSAKKLILLEIFPIAIVNNEDEARILLLSRSRMNFEGKIAGRFIVLEVEGIL